MESKKGVELSINVIIIAIIALVVLVVLLAIFTGRMGIFSKYISGSCVDDHGGTCKKECDIATENVFVGASCPNKGEYCCVSRT